MQARALIVPGADDLLSVIVVKDTCLENQTLVRAVTALKESAEVFMLVQVRAVYSDHTVVETSEGVAL